jgi:hypothetical protein
MQYRRPQEQNHGNWYFTTTGLKPVLELYNECVTMYEFLSLYSSMCTSASIQYDYNVIFVQVYNLWIICQYLLNIQLILYNYIIIYVYVFIYLFI